MADFNQVPSGQAPFSLTIGSISLGITSNVVGINPGFYPNSYPSTASLFSLSQNLVPPAPPDFDMYPSYRRPIRLIESTPVS